MSNKTLVIVESPGKIKKIGSYLGPNYIVKASFGHVYDLNPKGISVDINNNFEPQYEVTKDKRKVVSELRNTLKSCKDVILAADDDREGEAIAWCLAQVLKLKNPKRMIFHEITKSALQKSLKNIGKINDKLVKLTDNPSIETLKLAVGASFTGATINDTIKESIISVVSWCPT